MCNIPEITKETLETIQLEQKGQKVFYERRNKGQPEMMEDITPKRFIRKVPKKMNESGSLTFREQMDADVMWIKNLKGKSFMTNKKQLKTEYQQSQLNPRIQADGIIRPHRCMINADLLEEKTTPILLPKRAYFTTLLIKYVHNQNFLAGISHTLALIRSKYWLPQERSQVKQVLGKCLSYFLTCIKHLGSTYKSKSIAPWQNIKINESPAFTNTGLDFFGPLYVKNGAVHSKAWVCSLVLQ